jgi:hypothetical protein
MEVTYYLFGEEAVNAFEENGAEIAKKAYHSTFRFAEGQTKSLELAEAINGWQSWMTISRKDYFKISILPFTEIKKIGWGEDTVISFRTPALNSIHIFGNFYGDVFEEDSELDDDSKAFFDEFWEEINSAMMDVFTEEERRA